MDRGPSERYANHRSTWLRPDGALAFVPAGSHRVTPAKTILPKRIPAVTRHTSETTTSERFGEVSYAEGREFAELPEHPRRLLRNAGLVRDGHADVDQVDGVHRPIAELHVEYAAFHEADAIHQARPFRERAAVLDELSRQLDASQVRPGHRRDVPRRTTKAASEIENAALGRKSERLHEGLRRVAPADVELIDRSQGVVMDGRGSGRA